MDLRRRRGGEPADARRRARRGAAHGPGRGARRGAHERARRAAPRPPLRAAAGERRRSSTRRTGSPTPPSRGSSTSWVPSRGSTARRSRSTALLIVLFEPYLAHRLRHREAWRLIALGFLLVGLGWLLVAPVAGVVVILVAVAVVTAGRDALQADRDGDGCGPCTRRHARALPEPLRRRLARRPRDRSSPGRLAAHHRQHGAVAGRRGARPGRRAPCSGRRCGRASRRRGRPVRE